MVLNGVSVLRLRVWW